MNTYLKYEWSFRNPFKHYCSNECLVYFFCLYFLLCTITLYIRFILIFRLRKKGGGGGERGEWDQKNLNNFNKRCYKINITIVISVDFNSENVYCYMCKLKSTPSRAKKRLGEWSSMDVKRKSLSLFISVWCFFILSSTSLVIARSRSLEFSEKPQNLLNLLRFFSFLLREKTLSQGWNIFQLKPSSLSTVLFSRRHKKTITFYQVTSFGEATIVAPGPQRVEKNLIWPGLSSHLLVSLQHSFGLQMQLVLTISMISKLVIRGLQKLQQNAKLYQFWAQKMQKFKKIKLTILRVFLDFLFQKKQYIFG